MSEAFLTEINRIYQGMGIDFDASWFPVFYLLSKNDSLSIKELSKQTEVSHPAASQLITNLKSRNLVETTVSADDGRKQLVQFTEQGRALLAQILPVWDAITSSMTELADSDPQIARILPALSALENNFKAFNLSGKVIAKLADPHDKNTNGKQLMECVPNFSEGVDTVIIERIADEIASVAGVKLLNVDPGKAANRTVMTFIGEPAGVVEAAFLAIKKAGELIDMRVQKGEHPRMGATDVCPLIPIASITMDETVSYARELAKRVGEELTIPVYLYEHAQSEKSRSNLSVIRAGEYEGFFGKIKREGWKPDFGPAENDAKRGATVIGARDFLIAYNVNLDTNSVPIANEIAFDVRESGRKTGKDKNGKTVKTPGSLKNVKAIGWYIAEYGKAQVSMNLANILVTPIHTAFDEVSRKARERGITVTGSELIGMIPLEAMLDAGRYFLEKQQRSVAVSDAELIDAAVKSMGLDELRPFNPQERIIEYLL